LGGNYGSCYKLLLERESSYSGEVSKGGNSMDSSKNLWETVQEKGLGRTMVYTAIGSVMIIREILESTFERLVKKGETSDDPCARAVRNWLYRKERTN